MTEDLTAATRRNLVLLAAAMAALYGMVELAFGAATLTFEETGGSKAFVGFAPALFLLCAALAALPAGRAMDRGGSRPILVAGFASGLAGGLLAGLGVSVSSLPLALLGFGLTGAATGTVLLSRAAAAAMFPPAQRPRAIALVLFGAVFGALLGPLVFSPLLAGSEGGAALDTAWLGAAGFMLAGLIVASRLDPDPNEVARMRARAQGEGSGSAAGIPPASEPLRRVVLRPRVPPALLAVLASWAGMVTLMALAGAALVGHGHGHSAVFPVLCAHFVGMFALFAVIGRVIERVGRVPAIAAGLLLLAASGISFLGAVESAAMAALALFGVGLGWSLSFVAATAELSERAPPGERATLIGFSDLLGNFSGAVLVVVGGFALDAIGLVAICVGAAALPLVAAVSIVRAAQPGVPAMSTPLRADEA